ncbi:hypothetical protein ACUUL3_15605 [Thiovibrio sp. JS02]
MERTLVSEKELLSYLNKELQRAGQLEECRFDAIVRMRIDDRSGCNWASATVCCGQATGNVCPPAAERIVNEAKKRFNLK